MEKNLIGLEQLESLNVVGPMAQAKYYRFVAAIMKEIHAQIPEEVYDTSKVATPTELREEFFQGLNYQRAVIYLMSNGCEWALKDGHGCTVCGHLAKQTRKDHAIPVEDYVNQFKEEFEQLDCREYPLINLYNNGSFFNKNEIPSEASFQILEMIGNHPHVKMLVLESRLEFISEEVVRKVRDLLADKHVEIAVGLEVVDDFWRFVSLNKGFSLRQFDQTARIITKYLNLRTYVMLKPPFLSELEGIEMAVKTIEHAFKMGSATVSLEACTVQDYTLAQYLFDQGEYQTPWLWSIIEVVKRTAELGKLIIGLFQFYPSPSKVPHNCPVCSERVMEAIKEYNRTLDLSVFDHLECECQEEWRNELAKSSKPFSERLGVIDLK